MGYLAYLNPKFYPILAASSPRIRNEFLYNYGKALNWGRKGAAKIPGSFKNIPMQGVAIAGTGGIVKTGLYSK